MIGRDGQFSVGVLVPPLFKTAPLVASTQGLGPEKAPFLSRITETLCAWLGVFLPRPGGSDDHVLAPPPFGEAG